MKKTEIKITYDADKFAAVKRYMEKKDVDILDELESSLGKLYEKYVPQAVREFIDLAFADTETEAPSKQKKAKDAAESSKPAPVKAPLENALPKEEHPVEASDTGAGNTSPVIFPSKVERPSDTVSAGTMKLPPDNTAPYKDERPPAPTIAGSAKVPLDSPLSESWQRRNTL